MPDLQDVANGLENLLQYDGDVEDDFGLTFQVCKATIIVLNTFHVLLLHSRGIRLQWSIRKLWQIFSNERHWSRDEKIGFDILDF